MIMQHNNHAHRLVYNLFGRNGLVHRCGSDPNYAGI